jgi:hypothetical protein
LTFGRETDKTLALAPALALNGALSTPIIRNLPFHAHTNIYHTFHAIDMWHDHAVYLLTPIHKTVHIPCREDVHRSSQATGGSEKAREGLAVYQDICPDDLVKLSMYFAHVYHIRNPPPPLATPLLQPPLKKAHMQDLALGDL